MNQGDERYKTIAKDTYYLGQKTSYFIAVSTLTTKFYCIMRVKNG